MQTLTELLTPEKNLGSPHLPTNHPLFQILDSALAARDTKRIIGPTAKIFWPASRFKLNQSSLFTQLNTDHQDRILLRLSELNLALSYFIEKSGHHYSSKMILLSESSEEKTLYALFAAEEATHLREFMNYMWFTPTPLTHPHPMVPVLSDAIQWGSRNALVFVIQVLLEGFGIGHYSGLKDTCLDSDLKNSFQGILRDEARHHGAGLILSKTQKLDTETEDQVFELSRKFIRSMETAHWLAGAFEDSGKPLTQKEKEKLWEDTDFRSTLSGRMQRLLEMFQKTNYHHLFEKLENEGVFKIKSL